MADKNDATIVDEVEKRLEAFLDEAARGKDAKKLRIVLE